MEPEASCSDPACEYSVAVCFLDPQDACTDPEASCTDPAAPSVQEAVQGSQEYYFFLGGLQNVDFDVEAAYMEQQTQTPSRSFMLKGTVQ